MDRKPKISIIMGIYNCEKYLKESIDSILNQTYHDWEFIMCDDGSTDETYMIAKNYEEKYPDKFLILKNGKNMGLNYTLNKCIKYAKGEYLARQDGDDVSLPTRFEKQVKFLDENPDIDFVSSTMIFFDETGDWGISHLAERPTKMDFISGSPFSHAATMIRKDVMEKVGCYSVNDSLLRVEDYHLWFKLYMSGSKGYNFQEPLYKMRDNHDAFKRRTWKNRLNEMHLKKWGFKQLDIPHKYYFYVYRPIIVGLLPKPVYMFLHKKKLK